MLVSRQSGGRGWSVLRSGGDDLSVSFVTGRFSGASLGDYIRRMEQAESMRNRFAVLSPHLDEKGRRLLAVIEAQCLGRGGIKQVSDLIGVARSTIRRGLKDIDGVSSPARAGPGPARGRQAQAGDGASAGSAAMSTKHLSEGNRGRRCLKALDIGRADFRGEWDYSLLQHPTQLRLFRDGPLPQISRRSEAKPR